MKFLLSVLAICVAISLTSCGGDGDCSGDYVGTWNGSIDCSGEDGIPIDVVIAQVMGDTMSINANGENFLGVLSGCDFNLIPQDVEIPIFGKITISGDLKILSDDLVFTQRRSADGEEEICTFVGSRP